MKRYVYHPQQQYRGEPESWRDIRLARRPGCTPLAVLGSVPNTGEEGDLHRSKLPSDCHSFSLQRAWRASWHCVVRECMDNSHGFICPKCSATFRFRSKERTARLD